MKHVDLIAQDPDYFILCSSVFNSAWYQKLRKTQNLEPEDPATPDRLYQRRWALTLLDRVVRRLEEEHAQAGKAETFAGLKEFLTAGRESRPYRRVAEALSMTEGAGGESGSSSPPTTIP